VKGIESGTRICLNKKIDSSEYDLIRRAEDIKWLHVEPSTKCNAWCPACPRNKQGFGLIDGLVEEDLSTERFHALIKQLPNLYAVQFCGNYGDPIIAQNILELICLAKQYCKKIQIHTNGSLRTAKWWEDLALLLADIEHDVWFGIDGIGDTHSIYRQGTDYDKIINNASSFINAGGRATWQFIPYAHNEHQIREALITSKKLKFEKFKLVKIFRNMQIVRNYRSGKEFNLMPPSDIRELIRMPSKNTHVKSEDCMHLTQPSIFMSANGKLSHCCYRNKIHCNDTVFDNLDDLLHNAINLSDKICIDSCGST
jgi:MoaA/NifB/PqqE/SkfB family radical SAM enzyme